jgi:hypothetical protein
MSQDRLKSRAKTNRYNERQLRHSWRISLLKTLKKWIATNLNEVFNSVEMGMEQNRVDKFHAMTGPAKYVQT